MIQFFVLLRDFVHGLNAFLFLSAVIQRDFKFLITGGFETGYEGGGGTRSSQILEVNLGERDQLWTLDSRGQLKHPRGGHAAVVMEKSEIGKIKCGNLS